MNEGRNIKLLVAYDGTDFCGWQRQGADRSVQGVIEDALQEIHKQPVTLTGSGRTDSGVHAVGQVANFYTDIPRIPAEKFVPALNTLLPSAVRILESAEAAPGFHARFDAAKRSYRYHFICGRHALPHESRYAMQLWRYPRLQTLNGYCRLLLGERDCTAFAGAGDASKSRCRYISNAAFFVDGGRLVFEITANAFLYKMVRSIAGTFLHYEEENAPLEKVKDIIDSGDRSLAGPTLPPQGLFLWKIDYR